MKKALFQMHLAVVLWGFTGVLGKEITLGAPMQVWYRMLLTALFMAAFVQFRKEWVPIPKKDKWRLAYIGCLMALHWVAFFGAIKLANVSIALVCMSTAGIFTSLFDPFVNDTKHNVPELLIGLLGIVGVYLIYQFQQMYALGVLSGLTAAILAAWFTVLNKKITSKYPSRTLVFYEMGTGWILLNILIPIYILYSHEPVQLLPQNWDWLWLIILSLCCTVWAQYLALNALKHISSFTSSLSVNLEPVYGILLAFAIYHEYEMLHKWFYLGMALILFSVVLQMLRVLRPDKKPTSYIKEKAGID
ncbi:MAG: EamA family transporter [Chitinophagaceae bacterium]|nr:EamA family transporter [Chitinophagaceae bacterium]